MTILLQKTAEILKVDRRLGIAFGFALICKSTDAKGAIDDYYDLHGDHTSEEEMVKAAADFAMTARVGKAQHGHHAYGHDKVADVVFMFPLTEDFAKAVGIISKHYGLLIGYKPIDPRVLDDIDNGVYKGFSFGGDGVRTEVIA